jgi:hypothetical protein
MIVTCDDVVMNVWLFTCYELAFVVNFITCNLLVYNETCQNLIIIFF